jgi:tRNA dimethylallyltransferase
MVSPGKALHLTNKLSKEEMINKLNTATWHFAKRQMTWWKRDKEIKWFDMSKSYKSKINKEVRDWIK